MRTVTRMQSLLRGAEGNDAAVEAGGTFTGDGPFAGGCIPDDDSRGDERSLDDMSLDGKERRPLYDPVARTSTGPGYSFCGRGWGRKSEGEHRVRKWKSQSEIVHESTHVVSEDGGIHVRN